MTFGRWIAITQVESHLPQRQFQYFCAVSLSARGGAPPGQSFAVSLYQLPNIDFWKFQFPPIRVHLIYRILAFVKQHRPGSLWKQEHVSRHGAYASCTWTADSRVSTSLQSGDQLLQLSLREPGLLPDEQNLEYLKDSSITSFKLLCM